MTTPEETAINEKIAALETKVREHDLVTRAAQAELDDLYRERSRVQFGVVPGVIVRDRKGCATVVSVRPERRQSKPWLTARRHKKDGSPGDREITIFGDWEIVA